MTGLQKDNKKKRTRRIAKMFKIALVIYCAGGIALYYLQETLLFRPVPLPPGYPFKFNVPFKEVNIPLNKQDNLSIVQFLTGDSLPKGVVLYFHGNRDNVNRYAKYAANFTKHGYEIWIIDYPGYGKTTGKLTEQNLYNQAREMYKLANARFDKGNIIIYGKSLGSGVAAYLASKKPCRRLILETPYYSIPDLFSNYTPFYPVGILSHFKFPTGEYLREVNIPVTIFHGSDDWIIPYRCAAKLKQFLKPGDEFITIDNGSHNNLHNFHLFNEKLDSVLSL